MPEEDNNFGLRERRFFKKKKIRVHTDRIKSYLHDHACRQKQF